MKIYGLSGKSGTGKSYNAGELCGRMHIPAIIDDGLYIYGSSISAGNSAKKQETRIGAVKTALFMDNDHCAQVRAAIRRTKPDSILILGTSDDMVEKIAERLGLPKPSRIIHIEDITTPAQRTKASKERKEDGTHIIPAPTFEVKRQFSGYFLDPKRSFRSGAFKKPLGAEKTVVRPTFSYLGHYEISDKVVSDIVQLMAEATPGVANVLWVSSQNSDEGMYIRVVLQFEYGCKVRTAALAMQRAIHDEVAYMTAFNVLGVEVEIRGFKFK
ncbi:MAG: Asp23/Gls24 family envelope stress response protein [Firmicutes bacterium]|nr:Asp23/Gls24 family envelope stress response protein [Bacillota bacterium]